MSSQFLEAFKVGYAIAQDSKARNARKTMFEATGEAETLLSQMSSGAIPPDQFDATMDRINAARARWLGAASGDMTMTHAEFQEQATAFGGTDSKVNAAALARAEATWGSAASLRSINSALSVMDLEADFNVEWDEENAVVKVSGTAGDGEAIPPFVLTAEKLAEARVMAESGQMGLALMNSQLAAAQAEREKLDSEIAENYANAGNLAATADKTVAETGAIPVDNAVKTTNAAANAATADASLLNAQTNAAKAEAELAETQAPAALSELQDPKFVETFLMSDSPYGAALQADLEGTTAKAHGLVRAAAAAGWTDITASEAAALTGAGVSRKYLEAVLKKYPNSTVDQIISAYQKAQQ